MPVYLQFISGIDTNNGDVQREKASAEIGVATVSMKGLLCGHKGNGICDHSCWKNMAWREGEVKEG